MRLLVFSILIGFATISANAQKLLSRTYYKDKYLTKVVDVKKANYVKTVTMLDGIKTIQAVDLKGGEILFSESFKGEEPHGIWINGERGAPLDYSFDLTYDCSGTSDSSNLGSEDMKALTLSGYPGFSKFLVSNLYYPDGAKDNGIMGTVYVCFTIGSSGEVSNVSVESGSNILLSKEAARVIRMLKFDLKEDQSKYIGRYRVPIRFELH